MQRRRVASSCYSKKVTLTWTVSRRGEQQDEYVTSTRWIGQEDKKICMVNGVQGFELRLEPRYDMFLAFASCFYWNRADIGPEQTLINTHQKCPLFVSSSRTIIVPMYHSLLLRHSSIGIANVLTCIWVSPVWTPRTYLCVLELC